MKPLNWYAYLFIIGLLINQFPVFAQNGNIYDSTVISSKNMSQQREFWNNTYNFPAKPRNQWEMGASFGMVTISGDIPSILPTFGFEAHVRKALGYLFSIRLQYVNGVAKGLMWQPAGVNTKNVAWLDNGNPQFVGNLPSGKGYNATYRDDFGVQRVISPTLNGGVSQSIYQNYKTNIQDLSLQGLVTLNNIRFNKHKTNFTLYGGAGIGMTAYHVMVNALDANGNNYTSLFNRITNSIVGANASFYSNRKDVLKQLKEGMDNTYETEAESGGNRNAKLGKNSIKPSGTLIIGMTYRLSKTINIALEQRLTMVKTDLLDGQQWQVYAAGDVVQTRDYDSWNYGSLGINFNVGAKSVEPLWWLNPLEYAYSELNSPKHMKLPKIVFEDADGDGVMDQLDREPNTPAGCPVDTHGVTKDTDGDGVPDCKDKQLITPTECQPVDADGVGKCPESACCKENKAAIDTLKAINQNNCPTDYPSIKMKGLSLNKDNKVLLETIALKLKNNPTCNISITAYPKANKKLQEIANKKLEIVKNYLMEKAGISADRLSTNLVLEGGDTDIIDFK